MDFRICPSCEQSVLDDDVEDCPFCGASMSGKPSAKKKPSKPEASEQKKPVVEQRTKQKESQPKKAEKQSDSGDPFDVKSQASKKAPRIKQSMTSSCRLEVVCPMCEVVGFVPTSYQGREVRCHNTECLVPVFTVPVPEVVEETDERSFFAKYGLFIGLAVIVIGTIGGLVYSLQKEKKKENEPLTPGIGITENKPKETPENKEPKPTTENKQPEKPKFSKSEIQEEALRQLSISARQETQNRSRALLKRMASQGYVFANNLKEAENQLQALRNDQKAASFLQILPLIDMASHEMENGQAENAKTHLENAVKISDSLPKKGEEAAYFVTALVTALLAADMDDQAEGILKNYPLIDENARWGASQRVIVMNRTFDAWQESLVPFHQLIENPIPVAVVRGLIASGKSDKAMSWLMSRKNKREQIECKTAFLTEKILSSNTGISLSESEYEQLTQGISPIQNAFFSAFRANLELLVGKVENARASLAKSKEFWSAIELPKEFDVPDMEAIHDENFEPNDVASLRLAGLTAALVIKAETGATNPVNFEAAWENLVRGVELSQRIGPSPEKMNALDSQNNSQQATIQRQLKNLLKLETDSEARRAFNEYRRNVDDLKSLSDLRQSIIEKMLREAADVGLAKKIWEAVSKKEKPFDKNDGLLQTDLAGVLLTNLEEAEATDLIAQFKQEFKNLPIRYPYYWKTQRLMSRLSSKDDVTAAFDAYPKRVLSNLEERRLGVEIACLIAQSGNSQKTIDWILLHKDSIVREQALQFASGILATPKTVKELTNKVDRALFNPLEKGISNLSVLQKLSLLDDSR